MSYRNREIETKLQLHGLSLNTVDNILSTMFLSETTRSVFGSSVDTYYTIRNPEVRADFLRIRERDDGTTEITVKGKDRDARGLDRMEIDIHSQTKKRTIMQLFNAALGRSSGTIRKTYHVYWLQDAHTTVSCYQLLEPSSDLIYIELESTEEQRVLTLEAQVISKFADLGYNLEWSSGSLFEMWIEGNK